MTTSIRALIVDDEPRARQHLRRLLAQCAGITIMKESSGGCEAPELIRTLAPDLVFLDVEMAELDGFGVVAAIGPEHMPPVVFTTAHSEYAVRAFEAYALDYLLKPFDMPRLAASVERARREIAMRRAAEPDSDGRLGALLRTIEQAARVPFPDAIAVRCGAQYMITRIHDVDWIEADGNHCRLHVQQRARLLTRTLASLEKDILDPAIFVRVHRSAIVNTRRITAVQPREHGDLSLVLQDGTHVECSRRFRHRLEGRLYFTS